jgi:hypothetical protein
MDVSKSTSQYYNIVWVEHCIYNSDTSDSQYSKAICIPISALARVKMWNVSTSQLDIFFWCPTTRHPVPRIRCMSITVSQLVAVE